MSESELLEVRTAVWHSCVDRAVSVIEHYDGPMTAEELVAELYEKMAVPRPPQGDA